MLSIFDQTRKDEMDEHILRLDEQVYSDDRDMERIIHRLTMAAADADMRHRMNVEDEYFSIIEKRDTEILLKDQQLAEKNAQLAEQSAQLTEKNAMLTEKDAQLTEKNAMLRTSIQMLVKAGMSAEAIAENLGKGIDEVKQLMQ